MTLSDLQGHLFIASRFKWDFFVQLCSSWQYSNWHTASHGPSSIAEFLVYSCKSAVTNYAIVATKRNVISHIVIVTLLHRLKIRRHTKTHSCLYKIVCLAPNRTRRRIVTVAFLRRVQIFLLTYLLSESWAVCHWKTHIRQPLGCCLQRKRMLL